MGVLLRCYGRQIRFVLLCYYPGKRVVVGERNINNNNNDCSIKITEHRRPPRCGVLNLARPTVLLLCDDNRASRSAPMMIIIIRPTIVLNRKQLLIVLLLAVRTKIRLKRVRLLVLYERFGSEKYRDKCRYDQSTRDIYSTRVSECSQRNPKSASPISSENYTRSNPVSSFRRPPFTACPRNQRTTRAHQVLLETRLKRPGNVRDD